MLKASSGQSGLTGLEKKLTGRDPDDSAVPASVRKSVRFMLAGGTTTAVLGLFWLIVAFADKNAITDANGKKLSGGQFAGGVLQVFVLEFLLPAVIWLLMARFNRAGRNWARIASSVLCAIDTYLALGLINSLRSGVTLTAADVVYTVLTLAIWVVGVIAIVLAWRGESSAYFRASSARR